MYVPKAFFDPGYKEKDPTYLGERKEESSFRTRIWKIETGKTKEWKGGFETPYERTFVKLGVEVRFDIKTFSSIELEVLTGEGILYGPIEYVERTICNEQTK